MTRGAGRSAVVSILGTAMIALSVREGSADGAPVVGSGSGTYAMTGAAVGASPRTGGNRRGFLVAAHAVGGITRYCSRVNT